jgi:intraflagellar transport protein 172
MSCRKIVPCGFVCAYTSFPDRRAPSRYVGPSLVIVHSLDTGARMFLKSHHNLEIKSISVLHNDKFLVAHTPDTLLLASLDACKLSEIPWRGSGQEKFFFEFKNVAMIFNAGELSLVEYGVDDVLGSIRTEHVSPAQLSVRINDRMRKRDGDAIDSKRIAYLIDLHTVAILDLMTGETVTTITHDSKIETLDMNETGRVLLFRDKRHHLHLYDIDTQEQTTLLNYCSYCEWVAGSDVVVAQNRGVACIWYNITHPDEKTSIAIKGDIEGIERYQEEDPDSGQALSRTAILVDEGVNTAAYTLDEGLITFGTAMDDQDYLAACTFLESCEMSAECVVLSTSHTFDAQATRRPAFSPLLVRTASPF